MSWTTPAELRAQLQKLWDKGLLLTPLVDEGKLFPKRLTLKAPTSSELTEQFESVRHWITELRQAKHYRVVMRELRHRVLGTNLIPHEVWIDTLEDALAILGKRREAQDFSAMVALTRARLTVALPWLAQQPLQALQLTEHWSLLLDVVLWMQAHPRPGIYLRQIDLPGVHTKFIEAHRAVLTELLDLALPPQAIEPQATGLSQFCRRYGLLDKPLRIRFRMLDPHYALVCGDTDQDLTVNQDTFAQLDIKVTQVFITENEINFLAFPQLANSLIIFGAGYGFEVLQQAAWLNRCTIHYWGDIDTHGFAILDQLRAQFPHVESFLMDRPTLMAHQPQWGEELQALRRDLARLNASEQALYDDLRDNRIRVALRLEQERIGFGWISAALDELLSK